MYTATPTRFFVWLLVGVLSAGFSGSFGQSRGHGLFFQPTDLPASNISFSYDVHSSFGYDNHTSYSQNMGPTIGYESLPFSYYGFWQHLSGFGGIGVLNRLHASQVNLGGGPEFLESDAGLRLFYTFQTTMPSIAVRPHFDFSVDYRTVNAGTNNLATTAALKIDAIFANPYANSFIQSTKEVIEIGPYLDTRLTGASNWGAMAGRRFDFNLKILYELR